MKLYNFYKHVALAATVLLFSSSLFAQEATTKVSSDGFFAATKIGDGWAITEKNSMVGANIYLVLGKDSALIIDTGYGQGDLKAFIGTLTKLPLIVVNTHGHGDHAGNNKQFSKIYLHPDDFYMLQSNNKNAPKLVPIREGYVFNLGGGRKLDVMDVPGHTPGSIVLFDVDSKILFSGDNTNNLVWLFLRDCKPLEVYLQSLEKVQKRINDFNIVMPGHNDPLGKTFIADQIGCVKAILNGTSEEAPYQHQYAQKGVMLAKYGEAQVAYDPKNLRAKK
ncbi:MAG TPA: MBL fold metallo-hydrolase [Bacteroidales bacterium]|nr:MBL fold metallo-hydrolase [Bacteroidales bacterium]